jgi:hypothetical protein
VVKSGDPRLSIGQRPSAVEETQVAGSIDELAEANPMLAKGSSPKGTQRLR